jgi:hypothetical protein
MATGQNCPYEFCDSINSSRALSARGAKLEPAMGSRHSRKWTENGKITRPGRQFVKKCGDPVKY